MTKVVITTYGTAGDVYPFVALALAMKANGYSPLIAAPVTYQQLVESEGLLFHPVRPHRANVMKALRMTYGELIQTISRDPSFVLHSMILPYLHESYEDMTAALDGASILVANTFSVAAKLAAEKLDVMRFEIALQPSLFTNAFFEMFNLASGEAAERIGTPIQRFRRRIGLKQTTSNPFFAGRFSEQGTIALYSKCLSDNEVDYSAHTCVAGFVFYDGKSTTRNSLDSELEAFLAAGSRPLVFTLGTSAIHDAVSFVREGVAAAQLLGRRAIFVLDEQQQHHWSQRALTDIKVCGYVPYSLLFSSAECIVHHGGIGTTAQALRSGRPQLITPYLVDQPDNAQRVVRLGVGRSLPRQEFTAAHVAAELRTMLDEQSFAERALSIAGEIAKEDGIGAALRSISNWRSNTPSRNL